jgi:hypothetical protein
VIGPSISTEGMIVGEVLMSSLGVAPAAGVGAEGTRSGGGSAATRPRGWRLADGSTHVHLGEPPAATGGKGGAVVRWRHGGRGGRGTPGWWLPPTATAARSASGSG